LRFLSDIATAHQNASRATVISVAVVLVAAIAALDYAIPPVSLGVLYFVPILIVSGHLSRWAILAASALCSVLHESFNAYRLDVDAPLRILISFGGFLAAGLFASELSRNRRAMAEHVRELREQIAMRRAAQEQLSVLIETSPAAILIVDSNGTALLANESARDLLGFEHEDLIGQNVFTYVPALETVPPPLTGGRIMRNTIECRGRRRNGSAFLAQVWFSTYATDAGPRIAAILLDASEGVRDRGGAGLASMMRTSRILMGAVSHSVRNLSAASKVAWVNLSRVPDLADNEDFRALGALIRGLESIASVELSRAAERSSATVDLNLLLDELRVVIEPSFEEAGIELVWRVPDALPTVCAEHYGLLHAMLNICQNAERALARAREKRFEVSASCGGDSVTLRFTDTAGGVQRPERLFQPFHPDSQGSGLGLYVSRAIVRSFDGELRYQPAPSGSCFSIELAAAYNRISDAAASGN
jgi:PAS domain S-box-containing protein